MGLLSTAVLNVNNIRDYHEDISNNKRTLAVLLGIDRARIYHVLLISLAWVCLFIPVIISFHSIMQLLFVVTLPLFVKGIYRVYHFSAADELNSELKRLAMSSFLLALLWSLGQILATCN
jgi:1,4-dihydroxy-2-naphthoate octaprenyltransferase